MAGTIPLSMTQQFDVYGQPLSGGQLYIIQAGTVSTPQDAFQDTNLSIKMPYPMTLDAAGRVPQFFLADGTVKIRLQDKNGVVQLAADSVLVIGPTAGSSSAVTVDPTTLIQTGNMIMRYGVGVLAGYVRLNGLSIGSATSGATEQGGNTPASQPLFQYLYGVDTSLVLRDASQNIVARTTASNDWGLNRNLALPDWRGYAVGALDGMGNSLAGRLSAAYFGAANADALGAVGGGESFTLTALQVPVITPTVQSNTFTFSLTANIPVRNYANSGSSVTTQLSLASNIGTDAGTLSPPVSGTITPALVLNPFGGGQAHRTIGPRKLCTFYIKL